MTLGEKIKFFRKRAKFSQFELETQLKISPGSISRIENGQTNPNKETISKIAEILELSFKEKAALLDLYNIFPTEDEIQAAIEEVKDYFHQEDTIAILYDDLWIIRGFSKNAPRFFGLTKNKAENILGHNSFEVYFDPKYGIRQYFDENNFIEVMSIEIARGLHELDFTSSPESMDMFERLKHLPDFEKVLQLAIQIPSHKLMPKHKKILFQINGKKTWIKYDREKLKNNPRFEITEFYLHGK